jgi:signal transduction histidine kinase
MAETMTGSDRASAGQLLGLPMGARPPGVEFYATTSELAASVSRFLAPALANGEACIVIATREHATAIAAALRGLGFDLNAARAAGRYVERDAERMLERLLASGIPDERLFHKTVGSLLSTVLATQPSGVRVFGEMVDLLWRAGDLDATVRLEQLWAPLVDEHGVQLLCAYHFDPAPPSEVAPPSDGSQAAATATGAPGAPGPPGIERWRQAQRLRAELLRAERGARLDAERTNQRMGLLLEIAGELAIAASARAIAKVVVERGVLALRARSGALWLVDGQGEDKTLRLVHSVGYSAAGLRLAELLPLDRQAPLAEAVRSCTSVFLSSREEYGARYPASLQRFSEAIDFSPLAIACLPLIVEGRALGGLAFVFDDARTLDAQERAFATLLASHSAQALGRVRHHRLEQEARAEAEAMAHANAFLAEVGRVLSGTLDIEVIMNGIARLVVTPRDGAPALADWCAIDLLPECGGSRRTVVAHVDPEKEKLATELRQRYPVPPDALYGPPAVARSGVPEIIPDVSDEALALGVRDEEHLRLRRALGLRSAMCLPVAARGRAFGTISLILGESERRYGDRDLAIGQALAERCGLALDRAGLFHAEERARVQAQAARDAASFLADAGRLLTSSLEYVTTINAVARLAVECKPPFADWCDVEIFDAEGKPEQSVVAHLDPAMVGQAYEWRQRFPLDLNLPVGIARAVRTGEPELHPEISDEMLRLSARSPEQLELARSLGMRSMMVAPLTARGRTFGAILFVTTQRRYDEQDLAFAVKLADRCAFAVDNARLYREARQAVQQRDDFLNIVSHDLKNPLNAIMMAAHLVGRGDGAQGGARMRKAVETIVHNAERMKNLIEELLDVARIEAKWLPVHKQRCEVDKIVGDVVAMMESAAAEKAVRLVRSGEPGLELECDAERIFQVLANLIGNSLRFTGAGGTVEIEARLNGAEVEFSVRDDGPGIPADRLPHVFERYFSGDQRRGGTGLGLFICKGIVDAHDGRIWIESSVGKGTTVSFALKAT